MQGWHMLLPTIGFGGLAEAITGCVAAPPEYTSTRITLFFSLIAFAVAVAAHVVLLVMHIRESGGW